MINPIHLVELSPWPMLTSLTLVNIIVSDNMILNIITLLLIVFQWFRDIIRESQSGEHTLFVQKGITLGFLLFLISEIMLFISFFWAFFHSSLAPSIELGLIWPPLGINQVNPWGIPQLGSIVLLSSGFVVTLSHHNLLLGKKKESIIYLQLTIILGMLFIFLQFTEYNYGEFTITDSVYGSVFYMTTGLHAIHVIIGTFFLIVQLIRLSYDHFTLEHHLGYEFAIFYWHLVDIVWLFVFLSYYWWGSY